MVRHIFAGKCFKFVLFIAIVTSTVLAAPPKVIKTIPENGQQDVDPKLDKIRIEFDQDMDRGMSICGGGPKYPKTFGKPRWVNKRTLVMRVRLQPEHDYEFSVNCRDFKNCKNLMGEPAQVYPVAFSTGSTSQNFSEASTSDNDIAIEQLRQAINENYSYYKLRSINWDQLFERYTQMLKQAKTPQRFAEVTAKLLAHAKDMHIWVKLDEKSIRGGFRRQANRNYNSATLQKIIPNWKKRSAAVYTGRFEDGIGYILIDSWSRQRAEAIQQAFVAIWEFADAPGLVIDIRPNAGGAEPLAQEIAGCFIDEPALYAKHVYRDIDKPEGFGRINKRLLQPSRKRPRYRGKIAVLMGQTNASSCEAFLLMMKQVPNCKLIGETSYGSSGNPKPNELENGVTVYLPSWKALRPDGSCFEGEGIKPDITVTTEKKSIKEKDPVLESALAYLRSSL